MTPLFSWRTTTISATGPVGIDLSWLAGIPQPLAWAALATIVLVTVLFHFGGTIRERLRTRQVEAKAEPAQQGSAAALPQAVDTATQAYEKFIDHLLKQISVDAQERDEIVARLIRERNEAQARNQELQAEIMRLQQMLWRAP